MSQPSFQLQSMQWAEPVYTKICAAVDAALRDHRNPVAVFDFDNTCILGDIGELFSHFLIAQAAYRYDLDAFWALIDPRDGRDHIRQLVDRLADVEPDERGESAVYRQYLAEMGAIYGRKYRREGPAECYEWAVRLHVGMTPAELRRQTIRSIDREVAAAVETEVRHTRRGERVQIRHGIRLHEEIRHLMDALGQAGVEIWVVSATNQWSVETFAELAFGVDPARVLGNRVGLDADGRCGVETCEPVLYRQGKVDIIDQQIGRPPALVFGDSKTDYEMLCCASHLAVLIDCGHDELRRDGRQRNWAIQPQAALTSSRRWRHR